MSELIDQYFVKHLSLDQAEAYRLHQEYYKTYGLAIEGLVRHHKIDPLEYNRQVDDALPLEEIIFPDPVLRKLLEDIDKSKVKLWLLTNAYITHGKRVVRLLGVDDLFEGLTYCDYGAAKLLCKPSREMYAKAMREANISDVTECYFVGMSEPSQMKRSN
jgi:pyrimidine and pyridine-specific 5'-nucleotidase